MGSVYLIASGKGGVGKSTFCVSVAGELKKSGYKCILIDLDFGLRSLDLMLGVEQKTVYNLADVLNEDCEPGRAVIACDEGYRLNLITAPALCDITNVHMGNLEPLCRLLTKHYDFVLLDCPAGLSPVFRQCISLAQTAILITNPDPIAVRDAAAVSDLLYLGGLTDQRLVVSKVMYPPKENAMTDFDQVLDLVGAPLLGVLPHDKELSLLTAKGRLLEAKMPLYNQCVANIAQRLLGRQVPLSIQ